MKSTMSIKGTRQGLTITLASGELGSVLEELRGHLAGQGAFFRGGNVALRVADRSLAEEELSRISEVLTEYDMVLRTVVGTDEATRRAATALGLRLIDQEATHEIPTTRPARPARAPDGSKGLLTRRLVRSGQVVRHTGHVVIIGDVNTGAQIVAGGDVVVWGRLRGTVHAGAVNNTRAVVCALELHPTQLRIGQLTAQPDERDRPKTSRPEIAWVRDNRIVVEPWERTTWRA